MANTKVFTPADLEQWKGDATVESMLNRGIPLTRQNYLDMAYGADLPKPEDWNHEHEAGLPEPFRDPSSVVPE